MMRWLIALLVLLNLAFAAWHQGLLASWGWAPHQAREPARQTQQIRPEALRLTPREPAAEAATAPAAPPAPAAPDASAAAPTLPQPAR